jgi:hypothetical protein
MLGHRTNNAFAVYFVICLGSSNIGTFNVQLSTLNVQWAIFHIQAVVKPLLNKCMKNPG